MTDSTTIHHATLDGKRIAFSSETMFYVQLGRGSGSYKTRWSFKGDLRQAVFYYCGLNVGRGYKKRLQMEDRTLARQFS